MKIKVKDVKLVIIGDTGVGNWNYFKIIYYL
jgi:hypothetical protein